MTGLIYAFTGEGKGKTSAALGVATRSLLNGEKVVWISFYKQESWGLSEAKLKDKFTNLEMKFVGKGFRITNFDKKLMRGGKELKLATVGKGAKVVDTASEDEHKLAAKLGLEAALKSLEEKPFLLVMDEVLNAVDEGLITDKELLEVMGRRGEIHIVLTGRVGTDPARMILAGADLVTECKKIKHPYDMGQLAVKGLDF
jgi:cob(I)alamin adenosyltransferase